MKTGKGKMKRGLTEIVTGLRKMKRGNGKMKRGKGKTATVLRKMKTGKGEMKKGNGKTVTENVLWGFSGRVHEFFSH